MNLEGLNEEQRQAVLAEENAVLVLAGAGSGKTRVLTTKVAYLIQEKNVAPWHILAFTFTNKAAKEMRDRVEKALGTSTQGMWIGTFHSLCARLLRSEISEIGYHSDFTIYDTSDQRALMKRILKSMNASKQVTAQSVLSVISKYKNDGISVETAKQQATREMERLYARAFDHYETEKRKSNALDFDDLILKALKVLRVEAVREKYQKKFSHLFVDEYQDTNHPQYDLIRSLCGTEAKICVVGDADQSIYGWRGADITNILRFEKDFPGARTILLEQNYRSTTHILDAANFLIAHNVNRKEKNLWTKNGKGDPILFRETASEEEEAGYVVSCLEKEHAEGVDYSDMAILYRTNAQSRPFEDAFLMEGVPYRVVGGLKFYDRSEIKDLIAYMNLIVNPLDDVAFLRIINQPRRGLGPVTIEKLQQDARELGMSLRQTLDEEEVLSDFRGAAKQHLLEFRDLLRTLEEKKEILSPTDFAKEVYEQSGYRKMLQSGHTVEEEAKMDNISAFFDAISTYEEHEEEPDLVDYLQNLSLLSDVDKTQEQAGVNLMTIHSAKGLEFPVVFLVGLEEGLFPGRRAIEENQMEEERRLMYVAMTRAEKKLYLSRAQVRRVYGSPAYVQPSRFLDEMEGYYESASNRSLLSQISQPNHHDRNYLPRKGMADPKLRAEYDATRARFREKILERKKKQDEILSTPLRVGDKVRHTKFGEGTVISVVPQPQGDEITVAFDRKGLKRLNAKLAPITKI